MKELIEAMEKKSDVAYLIDTCFFIHSIEHGNIKKLRALCSESKVGMSSFNLQELEHIHHHFRGHVNRQIRDFLKEKIMANVPVDAFPGNIESGKSYVRLFDESILRIIPDASDAVLFALAMRLHADILTKDKHHIFTAAAENYSGLFRLRVLNEFP